MYTIFETRGISRNEQVSGKNIQQKASLFLCFRALRARKFLDFGALRAPKSFIFLTSCLQSFFATKNRQNLSSFLVRMNKRWKKVRFHFPGWDTWKWNCSYSRITFQQKKRNGFPRHLAAFFDEKIIFALESNGFQFCQIWGGSNPHAPRAPGLRCGALLELLVIYLFLQESFRDFGRVPWIRGYMDTWTHGRLDTWIHGYQDTCIHGHVDTWILDIISVY